MILMLISFLLDLQTEDTSEGIDTTMPKEMADALPPQLIVGLEAAEEIGYVVQVVFQGAYFKLEF